jgi:hypothetical protein
METFKIPVDVQIEDKIVGPLTFRHLLIVGVGGGLAYAVYTALVQRYYWPIWLPPTALISLLTLAFAFLNIFNMTFFQFLLALIEFNLLPKKRIWKQNQTMIMPSAITYSSTKNPTQTTTEQEKNLHQEKLKKVKNFFKQKNDSYKTD